MRVLINTATAETVRALDWMNERNSHTACSDDQCR